MYIKYGIRYIEAKASRFKFCSSSLNSHANYARPKHKTISHVRVVEAPELINSLIVQLQGICTCFQVNYLLHCGRSDYHLEFTHGNYRQNRTKTSSCSVNVQRWHFDFIDMASIEQ